MSKYYNLDDLITKATEQFKVGNDDSKGYFSQGTELEILTNEGKSQIKQSIINGIESDLSEAKEDARRLLVEKNTIMQVQRYLSIDKDTDKEYSKRTNELQSEYQKAHDKVKEIENYLFVIKSH